MLTPWKMIIIRFLREQNSKNLKNELSEIWPELHPDDKQSIYHFLYLSQQRKTFITLFALDANERSARFPWLMFLQTLQEANIDIPEKHFKTIIRSLKKHKIRLKDEHSLEETIQVLTTKKRYHFLQSVQEKKQELLSSAKIAKSEQLYEKQVEYLQQLKKLFPSDNSVKKIISERDRYNAEQVLARVSRIKKKNAKKKITFSEDEKEIINLITSQAEKYYLTNPKLANDFSIMLRNLGAYDESIKFISKTDNELSRDWQLLDLYLIGRQHINLLSHCELLKTKYANQPNALFSISYAEALAYWELDEKNKAIQLMSQIASMRPDFKSASEILVEWKEESVE